MTDIPILFSRPMVQRILGGRKTQTRRIIKPQPQEDIGLLMAENGLRWRVGDCLWVRETWADTNGECGPMLSYRAGGERFLVEGDKPFDYSKYPNCQFTMWCGDLMRGAPGHAWRSPIHMPRWASRITLLVTDVRVQRVQDISEEDAKAEGAEQLLMDDEGRFYQDDLKGTYRTGFAGLWAHVNGADAWDANPWVAAITFDAEIRN